MSDNGFEGSDKMSAEFVKDARGWADFLVHKVHRGPGDTVDAAIHRAEQAYGAPANWLHRLRYRSDDLRDISASAYFAIFNAYRAAGGAVAAAERVVRETGKEAYEHERARDVARITTLVVLADLVAGAADFVAGEEEAVSPPDRRAS